MSKIAGVIYPIPLQFVNRIFAEKKNVFVKYVTHPTCVRVVPKNKILFYVSHGHKEIVGEATIEAIEFLTPMDALKKHGDKIFLDRDELMEYTSQQPSRTTLRKMLVLVLSKPRKYSKSISCKKPITMTGRYFTEEDYNRLFQETTKRKGDCAGDISTTII